MFYQQGTQRIEVIVRKESGGGQAGAKETETENVSSSQDTQSNENQSSGGLTSRKKRIIKTNILHSLSAVKQTGTAIMNYYISGLGQQYGDQAYQQIVDRNIEVVEDVSNFATSIAMGAATGSFGGPVGAAVGAVIGAVTSAVSTGLKYAKRQREYEYKVFKENNAIEYQRARASISLTNGRLR